MTTILFITGRSGAGKTFLGDYLESYCGFKHIDGDSWMHSPVPEHKRATELFVTSFFGFIFQGKPAPPELWTPYYSIVCDQINILAQQDPTSKLAVSLSVYPRAVRDYLRSRLPPHLKFIVIDCPEEECVKRHFQRTSAYAKVHGMTLQEHWESENKSAFTPETFTAWGKLLSTGFEPASPLEPQTIGLVAASGTEILMSLHSALGWPAISSSIDVAGICDKNVARWRRKLAEEVTKRVATSMRHKLIVTSLAILSWAVSYQRSH